MRARPKLRGTHEELNANMNPAVCPYRVTRRMVTSLILNPSLCLLQRGSKGDLLDLNLNPAVCPYRVTRQMVTSLILNHSLCLLQRGRNEELNANMNMNPAVCPYRVTRQMVTSLILNPSLCLLQRGRCPFRQYMPSKPARYGIKIWVACDAQSSYAWKMQVYAGKPDKLGPPEKNLAARVVMDLTEGLAPGRNVTCDNFFTSRELATRLFRERGHTLLGTLRANRPEIPRELRCVKGRAVGSTQAAVLRGGPDGWSPNAVVLSYVAKKNKNVLLLTTSPRYVGPSGSPLEPSSNPDGGGGGSAKPSMVLHYNRTKGGVDNLDKVVGTYSCRRKTSRWPVALFHNMVDVAAYNAFVLWREIHPDWMSGKLNKRRLFLERLGKALVLPTLEARGRRGTRGGRREGEGEGEGEAVSTPDSRRDEPRETPVKRQRCRVCPRSKDVKTKIVCFACHVHVCSRCALTYCPNCAAARCPVSRRDPSDDDERRGPPVSA
ncbi:piggyBac transposable element-derived protein 4-like isoform X1 [Pelmatolapia mariae]|uniref:piggyBac transposable element-derived protein 4-like isoform X1 n=1 Tax=Pelmatolapia mariae TaxID=158779 RepID=UPI002FE67826